MTDAATRRQEHEAPAMGHAPQPPRATAQLDFVAKAPSAGLLRVGLWAEPTDDARAPFPVSDKPPEAIRHGAGRRAGRSALRPVVSQTPYRGRTSGARAAQGCLRDVAWDATLRSLARERDISAMPLKLSPKDLLVKVRVQRPAQLLLFVVDASGSMGGELTDYARRMATAALSNAYLERASVAMIVFRQRSAELVVGATRKVDRLHRALRGLPLGGTTPLAAALELAHRTLSRELARDRTTRPTLILISDGRANVGSKSGHERVLSEVRAAAAALSDMSSVRVLFLDTTEPGKDDRRARTLGDWLGAERVALASRTAAASDPTALAKRALEGWSRR